MIYIWQHKRVRKKNQKLWYMQLRYQSGFLIVILIIGIIIIQLVANKEHLYTINSEYSSYKNPYFYQKESVDLSAMAEYYDVETTTSEQIDIKVYLVKKYEKGELYRFVIPSIVGLGTERTNLYFYVTENQIYRLFSYVYEDDRCITFYDNDNLLTSTLYTDEKLIENSVVVCQTESMSDRLAQEEAGMHFSITKQKDNIVYSRCDIENNGEVGFYESFVWKKGKGLVEYRSGYKIEADILYLDSIIIRNHS